MLESVDVGKRSVADYEATAGREAVERLKEMAKPLRGARVVHLNATPYGGGVAEILRSEVPLLRDLGLAADWQIITGDTSFFSVTKTMHNALQGHARSLTDHEEDYDLVVAHDPQPLAVPHFHGRGNARWVWRCHIDTSERTWVLATGAGAFLAWTLGMIPSIVLSLGSGGDASPAEPREATVLGLALLMGLILGPVFGAAQWLELRRFVRRAALWMPANALA